MVALGFVALPVHRGLKAVAVAQAFMHFSSLNAYTLDKSGPNKILVTSTQEWYPHSAIDRFGQDPRRFQLLPASDADNSSK